MKLNLRVVSKLALIFGIILFTFGTPKFALAQEQCFCEQISEEGTDPADANAPQAVDPTCTDAVDSKCPESPGAVCVLKDSPEECTAAVTAWQDKGDTPANDGNTAPAGGATFFERVIPKCLLQDQLSPNCRDVSQFVIVLINIANYAFTIIGALALAVFVYGGFMLIISSGNSEKVSSAIGILTSAVIGLFVAFAGYMLIQFIGQSLHINEIYQLK